MGFRVGMSAALQFTLLPAKLKEAGFQTHMIGKGHLGYQTTDHLPIHRGFVSAFSAVPPLPACAAAPIRIARKLPA